MNRQIAGAMRRGVPPILGHAVPTRSSLADAHSLPGGGGGRVTLPGGGGGRVTLPGGGSGKIVTLPGGGGGSA